MSSQIPQRALWVCQTANSKPRLCATRNSRSRTSLGAVFGICLVYISSDIGLFVVLVARNNAVNLEIRKPPVRRQSHEREEVFAHDVFGMPIHNRILQIKAFEICNGCCFHLFGKPKESTELGNFGDVKFDQQNFFICVQKRHTT